MNSYRRPGMFGGFTMFPPVIKILLVSNIAIYLIFNLILAGIQIEGVPVDNFIIKYFALIPIDLGFYPWQLITYMFLHGGFFHLLLNMFALWMFGVELENMWGQKRFMNYYLLCGIGAGLCNLLIAPLFTSVGPTVGASGAIYGILVAFGYLFPDRKIFIYGIIPVKAKYLVIFYMLLEVFAVAGGTDSQIAHMAHLGGGVVGLIYMMIVFKKSGGFFDTSTIKNKFNNLSKENKTYAPPVFSNGAKNKKENVPEAKYKELEVTDYKKEMETRQKDAQDKIDAILDKLSAGGYQSLTEEEKKVLFQESKKL